jgi:D-aminopeptidase
MTAILFTGVALAAPPPAAVNPLDGSPGGHVVELPNSRMSPLFQGVMEAAEEAVYNALTAGVETWGHRGVIEALPLEEVKKLLQRHRRLPATP